MRDMVWIISTAQADGIAMGWAPPTSSQAAMQRMGRTRFPPASREYRIASWILTGARSKTAASSASFTVAAFPSMYALKSKAGGVGKLSSWTVSSLVRIAETERPNLGVGFLTFGGATRGKEGFLKGRDLGWSLIEGTHVLKLIEFILKIFRKDLDFNGESNES